MKSELSLNGEWQLAGFGWKSGNWSRVEPQYPISARVPGEVHPALMAAGLITDPLTADNADKCLWVEEKEWWYRRTFVLPPGFLMSQTYLEFDGLDTFASILLNGECVGHSENMFVAHRFDVTGRLKESEENTLEVRFRPAVRTLDEMGIDFNSYYARYNKIRIGARKMQASFGWDWLPRLVGAGIWLDTRVVSCDMLSISNVHVTSEINEHGRAVVTGVTLEFGI